MRNYNMFNDRLSKIFRLNSTAEEFKNIKNIEITLLEEDFFKKVEQLDWDDDNEKETFVYEMLSLTPNDRQQILDEMMDYYYI